MALTEAGVARRPFRILAGMVSVVCFVLAAVAGVALAEDRLVAVGIFGFVGIMMAAIAATGHWPPKARRHHPV